LHNLTFQALPSVLNKRPNSHSHA